jgi:hypothetical protein
VALVDFMVAVAVVAYVMVAITDQHQERFL